jgi:hypothetical protein
MSNPEGLSELVINDLFDKIGFVYEPKQTNVIYVDSDENE